ncbi:hypothetical protein BO94DRAFT_315290 [Aspergillus sclerotioniger CBS 115572]|uniref:Uncharacterized protein n=1 Tax=Aspergillus sclerotioniger CBS 115572 TaxID=1450535 RepID=A0A317XAH2_9EURO|nr:hypothetical protein BO94DRAFT_315290 [Aspergillus sclerotioniger CBS 115572]PWY93948.1 hypothetical protein BO94DRAFT_315290 [Aspergillus sclerotioniger CBS 115572]
MSDLQIATGIAILISGYAQLRCGISCYHWQFMGRLAWFSCLTHLSCLTLLRNYLHNHPSERHWRLVLMFALVVMLIVAIFPSGNYEWIWGYPVFHPSPSDHAICYFLQRPSIKTTAGISMSIYILTTGFGFLFRIVKLHKILSVYMVRRPRKSLSKWGRKGLWKIFMWRTAPNLSKRLLGNLLYLPLLSVFLVARVALDHWSSMYFEIYWLVMCFLFAIVQLIPTLELSDPTLHYYLDIYITHIGDKLGDLSIRVNSTAHNITIPEPDLDNIAGNRWGFGQIMPVVLLALPLLPIVEIFYPGRTARSIENIPLTGI